MVGGEQGRGVSWISYSHKLYHTITREGQSSFFFLFVPTLFPSLSLSRTPSPHSLTTLLLLFLTIPHLLSNQSHPLTSNLSPSLSTLMYMTVADGSSVYSHRCQITLIDDLSKINHFMLTFFLSSPVLRVCLQGEWWWCDCGGAGTLPHYCSLEERATDVSWWHRVKSWALLHRVWWGPVYGTYIIYINIY